MIKTIIILYFVINCCYGYKNYFRANWECADKECEMISCEDGFADCNDDPIDGCEVNTNIEIKNCGHCDVECPAIANGVPTCILGKCGIGWCNVGFADCNYNPLDGCEVNLNTDIGNCGHCGIVCPSCISGKCIGSCSAGETTCNGNCVNLQSDPNNCGACGTICLGLTSYCSNGACTGSCPADEILCNRACVNTQSDPDHCGSCTNVCSSRTCSNGACVNTGYTDYGCVCLGETSFCSSAVLLSGTPLSLRTPFSTSFNSETCFDMCYYILGNLLTFFTLAVDVSNVGINDLCQCYNTPQNNPTIVYNKCFNGHGITYDGSGSVELYYTP